MGGKNLKGIVAGGGGHLHLDPSLREAYSRMFDSLHSAVAEGKGAAGKYRDLGTARNLLPLNALQALPWRNLRDTSDQSAERLSGQRLAEERLLRRAACAGCPVGCIHIGMVGEQLGSKRDLPFRQVAYDFEPLFSLGTMLGMTDPAAVLGLLDEVERCGLDAISTGVALAWATEARERGIISQQETVDALRFGEPEPYLRAAGRLSRRENRFYSVLSRGTDAAARSYGGMDFACVLGQEMAGYATGEAFIAGQALGFRHSHLDSGGYRVDQTLAGGAEAAVQQLLEQEKDRVLLTCMVGCLFGREAYPAKILAAALQSLGYSLTEGELSRQAEEVRARRWRLRLAGGFEPEKVRIPERFLRIRNWKGSIDAEHLERIRRKYAAAIRRLAAREK
jgi:aldehyde:ferredoxin oxidoreductase